MCGCMASAVHAQRKLHQGDSHQGLASPPSVFHTGPPTLQVNFMASFNSAAFPDSLAVAKEGGLMIGSIDEIQKLHIRSVYLEEQPRRLAHQETTHTLGVSVSTGEGAHGCCICLILDRAMTDCATPGVARPAHRSKAVPVQDARCNLAPLWLSCGQLCITSSNGFVRSSWPCQCERLAYNHLHSV